MLAAVVEFDNEHPASSFPTLVGFPDVAVLVCGRVVTQTSAGRVDRFFDYRFRIAHVAWNRTRSRITGGEDCQTLIAAEREFHRNRAARRGDVGVSAGCRPAGISR